MLEKSDAQRKREAERPKPPKRKRRSPITLIPGNGKPFSRKRRVVIDDTPPTDPPRLLKATPHGTDYPAIRKSFDEEGVPREQLDAGTIAEAAEESGYTSSQSSALPGEPEAVSREEQERQSRLAREKKERVVMSPLYAIDKDLEKLEKAGHYKPGKVRFIRKLLNQLGEDAMRSAVEDE